MRQKITFSSVPVLDYKSVFFLFFFHKIYLRVRHNVAASPLSGYKPRLALLDWHNERSTPRPGQAFAVGW